MNNHELTNYFAALPPPPPPPEEIRCRACDASLRALAEAATDSPSLAAGEAATFGSVRGAPRHRRSARLWLNAAAAFAAFALLAAIVFPYIYKYRTIGYQRTLATRQIAADQIMLAELDRLFPGQLNAVVERNGTVQIDMIPDAGRHSEITTNHSQPLVVQFEHPEEGKRLRIISYSGHNVQVRLNGVSLSFDILATGSGDVMLAGDHFVWSPANPTLIAGWQVCTQPLTSIL